jgi:hypothetical protein
MAAALIQDQEEDLNDPSRAGKADWARTRLDIPLCETRLASSIAMAGGGNQPQMPFSASRNAPRGLRMLG